jgi:hypothetical protein
MAYPASDASDDGNPQLRNPQLRNPQLRNPQLRNPQLRNPQLRNPQLRKPHPYHSIVGCSVLTMPYPASDASDDGNNCNPCNNCNVCNPQPLHGVGASPTPTILSSVVRY